MEHKWLYIPLIIIIGTLIILSIKRNEVLYAFEVKLINLIIHSEQTTGLELKLLNASVEGFYDKRQLLHDKKTNISIERFIELVENNKIIPARNATFHNIKDCHNFKYLSHNGQYEYIVKIEKDDNGDNLYLMMVDDPINKGTYNFFNQEGKFWQRTFHHLDVILWLLYGTGDEDQSSVYDRVNFYFNRENACGG